MAEIWSYLALEASEVIASRFVGEIKAELEKLVDFPLTGVLREKLSSNLRVRFYGFYAIYYIPTEKELIVVRFLHGARDTAAIFDRGGFQI